MKYISAAARLTRVLGLEGEGEVVVLSGTAASDNPSPVDLMHGRPRRRLAGVRMTAPLTVPSILMTGQADSEHVVRWMGVRAIVDCIREKTDRGISSPFKVLRNYFFGIGVAGMRSSNRRAAESETSVRKIAPSSSRHSVDTRLFRLPSLQEGTSCGLA